MTTKLSMIHHRLGLLLATAMTAAGLTGCVYDNPNRPVVYRERPPVVVVVQDDYIYYPQYEMYYSSSRHQYGYRSGASWVWQAKPSHVSLNVLVASPSVRMTFHDAPEHHHSEVVHAYPKNWKQPDKGRSDKPGHSDDKGQDEYKH